MRFGDLLLLRLPLAIWVGAGVLAAVAAPGVFREVPSRDLAGRVFGEILRRLEGLFHVLSAVLVIGVFTAVGREGRIVGRSAATAGGIFLAVASNVYGSMVLRPRMAYYRAQAGSFDGLSADNPWKRKFGALHRRSTRVLLAGVASAVAALLCAP
ncbi:MAG: DUF4149 domain-containing protein [Thermoanaerobaculia bacterium]